MGRWVRTGLIGLGHDITRLRSACAALRTRRGLCRSLWVTFGVWWLLVVGSGSAQAVFSTQDGRVRELGVLASLTTAQDSHGFTLNDYELVLADPEGGMFEKAGATAVGLVLNLGWDLYRLYVGVALWLLEIVTEFTWLNVLLVPARAVANVLNTLIGDIGLVPALLTFSVLVSGIWLLRGRTGAGFGEMLITLIIGSLFTTVLVNPVELVAGPNGLLMKAQEAGVQISASFAGDEQAQSTGTMPAGAILDNLVRTPHQYINFGSHLDKGGGDCVAAYDQLVAMRNEVKDLEGPCSNAAVEVAADPAGSMMVAVFIGPASGALMLFVLVLSTALLLLVALVVFEAAKFVWELLKATLPGASRAGVVISACTMLVGTGMLIAGLASVGVFVVLLKALFSETSAWDPVHVFGFVDLMLIAAAIATAVLMFRGGKQGRKLGERVAKALSPQPTSMPAAPSGGFASAASSVTKLVAANQIAHRMRGPSPSSSGPSPTQASSSTSTETKGSTETDSDQPAPRRKPTVKGAAKGAVKGTYKTAKFATAYSIGAPVAVPRAAAAGKAALLARRAALRAKVAKSTTNVKDRAAASRDGVVAYGQEYAHNVAAASKWTAKTTGATAATQAATRAAAPAMAAATIATSTPTRGSSTPSSEASQYAPGPNTTSAPPKPSPGSSPTDVPPAEVRRPKPVMTPRRPATEAAPPAPSPAPSSTPKQRLADRISQQRVRPRDQMPNQARPAPITSTSGYRPSSRGK